MWPFTPGKQRPRLASFKPTIEVLEDRLALSTVYDALLLNDLTTDAQYTRPFRINEQGDVAGEAAVGASNNQPIKHAVLWTVPSINPPLDLGDLPGGIDDSQALDLNNRVGDNLPQATGNGSTGSAPFFVPHGFLWNNGNMMELTHLDGPAVVGELTNAYGINDARQVVGHSPSTFNSGHFPAAYWFPSNNYAPVELPDLAGGGINGLAYEINNAGTIVGRSSVAFVGDPALQNALFHAVRWVYQGNSYFVEDLGGSDSYATDINDKGQIVGQADGAAFIWLPAPDYGLPQGMTKIVPNAVAFGINNRGQVVGSGGFIWEPGIGARNLTDLVSAAARMGVQFSNARDINDQGQVVIEGSKDGNYQGVVLTPQPDPSTDASALFADLGSTGLWRWTQDLGWQRLTRANPEAVVVSASLELYADFGPSGMWHWSGTGGWQQLSTINPEQLVLGGNGTLYGDFGPGWGVWRWTSADGWRQLAGANPERLTAAPAGSADDLYGDFGGSGVWRWTSAGWQQLKTDNPDELVIASSGDIYGDFGAQGLFRWVNGTTWTQLSAANPEGIATAANGDLYGDFATLGVWLWSRSTGAWQKLSSANAERLVVDANGAVYADFGSGGLSRWTKTTGFVQLTTVNPEDLIVAINGDLFADYGSVGVWRWTAANGWTLIKNANAQALAVPGNGKQ